MGDSSSFSSLFALVDNHLSKTNIHQDCQPSTSGLGSFKMPSLHVQKGLSDTGLPSSGISSSSMRFPMPSLSLSERPTNTDFARLFDSKTSDRDDKAGPSKPRVDMSDCPINDVLALQLSNMFKAREAKEEQKKQQERENLLKLEGSVCLIDLMPAVQVPGQIQPQHVDVISTSSSMESLVIPEASDSMEDEDQDKKMDLEARPVSPLKPITTDMSHMLKHRIGKCSEFGKVLCARYRPVAAPYFRTHVPNKNIKVFDFSTPSPDDIVLAKLRKPAYYNNTSRPLTVYE